MKLRATRMADGGWKMAVVALLLLLGLLLPVARAQFVPGTAPVFGSGGSGSSSSGGGGGSSYLSNRLEQTFTVDVWVTNNSSTIWDVSSSVTLSPGGGNAIMQWEVDTNLNGTADWDNMRSAVNGGTTVNHVQMGSLVLPGWAFRYFNNSVGGSAAPETGTGSIYYYSTNSSGGGGSGDVTAAGLAAGDYPIEADALTGLASINTTGGARFGTNTFDNRRTSAALTNAYVAFNDPASPVAGVLGVSDMPFSNLVSLIEVAPINSTIQLPYGDVTVTNEFYVESVQNFVGYGTESTRLYINVPSQSESSWQINQYSFERLSLYLNFVGPTQTVWFAATTGNTNIFNDVVIYADTDVVFNNVGYEGWFVFRDSVIKPKYDTFLNFSTTWTDGLELNNVRIEHDSRMRRYHTGNGGLNANTLFSKNIFRNVDYIYIYDTNANSGGGWGFNESRSLTNYLVDWKDVHFDFRALTNISASAIGTPQYVYDRLKTNSGNKVFMENVTWWMPDGSSYAISTITNDLSVYASGTAATSQVTTNVMNFGTTAPQLTVLSAGTYLVNASAAGTYTVGGGGTCEFMLYKNSTLIANSFRSLPTAAADLATVVLPWSMPLPAVVVEVAATDTISLRWSCPQDNEWTATSASVVATKLR